MALYVNGKQISGGGGGGNTNSVELTYAEYQALTPEQQLDGTEYFITDINGDGQQFQPIIYSEEEREIGVWTDGKPLYEKTITFPTPRGRQDFVAHGIADVDRIFVSDWHARREVYEESVQGFEGTGSGYWASVFDVSPTGVSWRIGSDWRCDSVIITFRYTKTTDQAGSGTWTPQGVPAHHYSTDEQVVGTWVDGNTLYERTINFSATSGTDFDYVLDIANLDSTTIMYIAGGFFLCGANHRELNFYLTNAYNAFTNVDFNSNDNKYHIGGCITGYSGTCYVTIRYTKSST